MSTSATARPISSSCSHRSKGGATSIHGPSHRRGLCSRLEGPGGCVFRERPTTCRFSNIHRKASLYEAFPAAEARRLVERFEWHYTPKHGSWLDLAESELGVLGNRRLGARPQCQPHRMKKRAPPRQALSEIQRPIASAYAAVFAGLRRTWCNRNPTGDRLVMRPADKRTCRRSVAVLQAIND
jgi:hypothetical protein